METKRHKKKEELIADANPSTCANPNYAKGFPEVKKLCQNIMSNAAAQASQAQPNTTPAQIVSAAIQTTLPVTTTATAASTTTGYINSYTDPNTGMVYPNAYDNNGNFNPTILTQIQQDEATYGGGGGGMNYGYDTGAQGKTAPAKKETETGEEKEGMATWEKAAIGGTVLLGIAGAIWYFKFRKK